MPQASSNFYEGSNCIIFFVGMSFKGGAQIISSSCIASDSIKALYRNDADRLELRKIYENNLAWVDSTGIPQAESDTILNALIAVYNATLLPERDSVIDLYHIHTFPDPVMNSLVLMADTNAFWMEQLQFGNFTTGQPMIDSLILGYEFGNVYYTNLSWGANDMVVFVSDSNYNLLPLVDSLSLVPGVIIAEENGYAGDGNDIYATVHSDHVELIYELALGDCPSGCTWHRYWKFKVYYDCSVEFVASWGSVFEDVVYFGFEDLNSSELIIYPNPFSNQITIPEIRDEFSYSIYSITGQKLIVGIQSTPTISGLDFLTDGVYLIVIQTENVVKTIQIVKEG